MVVVMMTLFLLGMWVMKNYRRGEIERVRRHTLYDFICHGCRALQGMIEVVIYIRFMSYIERKINGGHEQREGDD